MDKTVLTGRRFNLGTGVGTSQWENSNASRRYPLADDADLSCPFGEPMPASFLSDACIMVPSWMDSSGGVFVSCAHSGPGLVSVSLSVGGEGVCTCTVPAASFEPYRPYQVVPVGDSPVRGCVSFGDVVQDGARTWRPAACRLSGFAVHSIPVGRLVRFLDDRNGESVSGDVRFVVQTDVGLEHSGDWEQTGEETTYFSLTGGLDDATKSLCDRGGETPGTIPYITSINGVRPDEFGQIAIVFKAASA